MNGAHDLGGMHGFGPIDIDSGRELFHAGWEKRVFAITLACGFLGRWNIDQARFARERMDPRDYLQTSYYEHWLHGLETLLVERGLLSTSEMHNKLPDSVDTVSVAADRIPEILARGGPANCAAQTLPKFQLGDQVVIKNQHPAGHTRAPRFIRGRRGEIARCHGSHVLPDTSSQPAGIKIGVHLYNVRFESNELWGDQGDDVGAVYVDVFEPYIQSGK